MATRLLTGRVGTVSRKLRAKKAVRKVQRFMGWGRYNVLRRMQATRVRQAKRIYRYEPTPAGKARMQRLGRRTQAQYNPMLIKKAVGQGLKKMALYGGAFYTGAGIGHYRTKKKLRAKSTAARAKRRS